jgi:thiol-disulfide isomerase/thioredoxin
LSFSLGCKPLNAVIIETDGRLLTTCRLFFILLVFMFLYSGKTVADELVDIPHVAEKAQISFEFDYLYAAPHRAFAIAPGGAWSWSAGKETSDIARASALTACGRYTEQKCVLYAADDEIVFDSKKWSGLWGPYLNRQQAKKAATGIDPGEIFPDLVFTDPQGLKKTISNYKGKVVFVHFWGCWCPPCRHEFASLIDMYRILLDTVGDQVEFVVLQMREPISQSRKWAKENNVEALPLSDSGVKNKSDTTLWLKSGATIDDRELATVFPASYVLDKQGVVVFSHMGSVSDWSQYVMFFRDVVSRSGK